MNRRFTSRKVTRIAAVFSVASCLYFICKNSVESDENSFKNENRSCPKNYRSSAGKEDDNITRIFFLETSGECCLTFRQACSVESALRTNPNALVTLYMNSPSLLFTEMIKNINNLHTQKRSCIITENLMKNWLNFRLVREDMIDYIKQTPLSTLIELGLLNRSISLFSQISDIVRVGLLWKQGGVYLDLDCIVLRPLDTLVNTVGLSEIIFNWVENGVMAFERRHPFLQYLMSTMLVKYEPHSFFSLGPIALSSAIQEFCYYEDKILNNMPMSCRWNVSMTLKSHQAFYALGGTDHQIFFKPANTTEFEKWFKMLNHSFVSHIYDAEEPKTIPENSLYGRLAQNFCPTTYAMAIQEGGF